MAGVVSVSTHSVRVDEELDDLLEGAENKSERVREALRLWKAERDGNGGDGLTEEQAAGYEWLRDRAGVGGMVNLRVAKTVLAQRLSIDKGLVKAEVLQPLSEAGYLDVQPRLYDVAIWVREPTEGYDE